MTFQYPAESKVDRPLFRTASCETSLQKCQGHKVVVLILLQVCSPGIRGSISVSLVPLALSQGDADG